MPDPDATPSSPQPADLERVLAEIDLNWHAEDAPPEPLNPDFARSVHRHWPAIRAALARERELREALEKYGRHLAGCASDRKGECRVCYGTGQIESTDSTEEGWWDCASCGGSGKAECVCGLTEALLAQSAAGEERERG